MSQQAFTLKPFPSQETLPNCAIAGQVQRQTNHFNVTYQLSGDLESLALPELSPTPERCDGLWERTCFECFLGLQNAPVYWEVNLSPTGDWNVYHFDDYRQGWKRETAIASPIAQRTDRADGLQVSLSLDISPLVPARQPLQVGVTTVLQTQASQLSYWALTHPAAEADFHHRDSFVLVV